MKTKRFIGILLVVAILNGVLFAAGKKEEDAQKTAEHWLALLDAGKYVQSWNETAPSFQRTIPKDQWAMNGKRIRESFGAVVSRKLSGAQYTKSVPGAPPGEYVILKFDSSFSNKRAAVETVTPILDKDGRWKVAGYFVK